MLLTFLFWNVNKRPLQERIARIVAAHDVDVVMLAEWAGNEAELLIALNTLKNGSYKATRTSASKLFIISRLSKKTLIEEFDDPVNRLTIRRLRAGPEPGLILAVSHMVSAVNWSRDSQAHQATIYANDIAKIEEKRRHTRTIWVGDFNMNPFHDGMIVAQGIHSVMTKTQAAKEARQVQGREYSYFYNPMWGFFGDRSEGPAGTHYYPGAESITYFWNIYDQVLLRPSLMHNLSKIAILDHDGVEPLTHSNGIPDDVNASDHLPLLFILDL